MVIQVGEQVEWYSVGYCRGRSDELFAWFRDTDSVEEAQQVAATLAAQGFATGIWRTVKTRIE